MKIRNGFVSNSSSSSFVIKKSDLTDAQINCIENHIEISQIFDIQVGYNDKGDAWDIESEYDEIKGDTYMDNFDMEDFLKAIGVKDSVIEWSD